jgi:hypothetical protein
MQFTVIGDKKNPAIIFFHAMGVKEKAACRSQNT